ncbi:MAG: hypothetical protein V7682_11755, partial [Cycloclasticus sp.]
MKNQFGYRLIKVKGILCSGAFFLGMMMSMSANAAVTITAAGQGLTTGDVLVEQSQLDTTNTSVGSNATDIGTNTVSIGSNATDIGTNTVSIGSNA